MECFSTQPSIYVCNVLYENYAMEFGWLLYGHNVVLEGSKVSSCNGVRCFMCNKTA